MSEPVKKPSKPPKHGSGTHPAVRQLVEKTIPAMEEAVKKIESQKPPKGDEKDG